MSAIITRCRECLTTRDGVHRFCPEDRTHKVIVQNVTQREVEPKRVRKHAPEPKREPTGKCLWCGTATYGLGSRRSYCSAECRMAARAQELRMTPLTF